MPLSPQVKALIEAMPKHGPFVFSSDGKSHFSGFSKAKRQLDLAMTDHRAKMGEARPMPAWRLHDLRRTARSLMSGAGGPADIAERVLGHAIPGVRGTYDKHDYLAEKRDALLRLAARIERILAPATGNVVPLAKR